MKRIFTILAVLLMTVAAWAQSPKLSYQAVVRDNNNKLVVNNTVKVQINVLKADNTAQFTQTFNNVNTNRNGLISLELGDETENWSNVVWTNAKIRVAITLPEGQGVVVDTTDVTAVPLSSTAYYAENVNPTSVTTIMDTNSLVQGQLVSVVNDSLKDGNSAINHTVDTIAIQSVLNYFDTTSSIHGDAAIEALAHRVDVFNTNVCDSVAECLSNNINLQTAINNFIDTSSVYHQNFVEDFQNYTDTSKYFVNTINNIVDTSSSIISTLNNYVDSSSHIAGAITNYIDSSKHYVNSIATNIDTNKNVQNQIITVVNDTLMDGNSALNHTVDTIAVQALINYFDTTSSIHGDSAVEALAHRVDVFNTNVCDSVAECLSNNVNLQTAINNFIDTSSVYHQNFVEDFQNYTDTSKYFVNTINNIVDTSSSIISTLNNYVDSSSHIAGAITNYIDSSKHYVNSIVTNIDTNKNVQNQIITVVNDTLMDGNSALNHTVDTIAVQALINYFDTTSSIHGDSAIEALAHRVDVFNTNVCDSVAECLSNNVNLQTAINNFIDTSSVYHQNFVEDFQNYTDSSNYFVNTINNIVDTSSSIINTLNNYVDSSSHITDRITNYIDSSKHYVSTIITNIDTNKNVQSQIITVVNDTLKDGKSALNHTVDTIVKNNISNISSEITTIEGDITTIKENYLTIAGLCDSIKKCSTITDIQSNITKLQTDTVNMLKNLIENVTVDLSGYYTKTEADNTFESKTSLCSDVITCVNNALADGTSTTNKAIDTIALQTVKNYIDTTSSIDTKDIQYAMMFTIANATDSTNFMTAKTALTIPEGYTEVKTSGRLIQLYINGVYVGDSVTGLVTLNESKKVVYDATKNGGYKPKVGDRIHFVYWVK